MKGKICHSKSRKGVRFSVYEDAEKFHGYTRINNNEDGIYYDNNSNHLIFQIIFKNETDACDFESAIRKIPLTFRKRAITDENDIKVEFQKIQVLINDNSELCRVFGEQYVKIEDDEDPSPDYDQFTNDFVSTVTVNEETKLKLVDDINSLQLFRQKPEKCHLISQFKYKNDKNNPNNIILMSRYLHQQFDALDSTEGIPQFYFKYISHNSNGFMVLSNNQPCMVYETIVNMVFYDEEGKTNISFFVKDHKVINLTEIQFILYFQDPSEFCTFAKKNEDDTKLKWLSYKGIGNDTNDNNI